MKKSRTRKTPPPPPYLSWGEYYTSLWCEEMEWAGFLESWEYETETYCLCDGEKVPFYEQLKTKKRHKSQELLRGHRYTPDFKLILPEDYNTKIFREVISDNPPEGRHKYFWATYNDKHELCVYLEVKGAGVGRGGEGKKREATLNQKWLYATHGILTTIAQIHNQSGMGNFFEKTFTPSRYLLTDVTQTPRKIRYTPRTLDQWISSL